MCTAISYKTSDHYFGRNLDWEFSFGEKITITPRNFKLRFKNQPDVKNHYAIIGMALTENNYPLYFDATNEHGLSIAGLGSSLWRMNSPNSSPMFPPAAALSRCSLLC